MEKYPKEITEEMVNELQDWYTQHQDSIPVKLELNSYTYFDNLPDTIDSFLWIAHRFWENPVYYGYIYRLIDIKNKLEGDEVL